MFFGANDIDTEVFVKSCNGMLRNLITWHPDLGYYYLFDILRVANRCELMLLKVKNL